MQSVYRFFPNGHILGVGSSDETGVQQMPKPSEQTSRSPVNSPCHSISRKKRKDLMQLSVLCFRFVFSIYTCFVNLILSIFVLHLLYTCCSLCENLTRARPAECAAPPERVEGGVTMMSADGMGMQGG